MTRPREPLWAAAWAVNGFTLAILLATLFVLSLSPSSTVLAGVMQRARTPLGLGLYLARLAAVPAVLGIGVYLLRQRGVRVSMGTTALVVLLLGSAGNLAWNVCAYIRHYPLAPAADHRALATVERGSSDFARYFGPVYYTLRDWIGTQPLLFCDTSLVRRKNGFFATFKFDLMVPPARVRQDRDICRGISRCRNFDAENMLHLQALDRDLKKRELDFFFYREWDRSGPALCLEQGDSIFFVPKEACIEGGS